MNGHAKGCECADCVAARECGMEEALELIAKMQDALSISDAASMEDGHEPIFGALIDEAASILAQHGDPQ